MGFYRGAIIKGPHPGRPLGYHGLNQVRVRPEQKTQLLSLNPLLLNFSGSAVIYKDNSFSDHSVKRQHLFPQNPKEYYHYLLFYDKIYDLRGRRANLVTSHRKGKNAGGVKEKDRVKRGRATGFQVPLTGGRKENGIRFGERGRRSFWAGMSI